MSRNAFQDQEEKKRGTINKTSRVRRRGTRDAAARN